MRQKGHKVTWFKVDDGLAMHSKVIAAGNAAMGLWVRAGAWSAQQNTAGRVPVHVVRVLGSVRDASRLVTAGLWTLDGDCYVFHEWDERNPDAASVQATRAAKTDGGKRGNHERWHVKRGVKAPGCEWCGIASASHMRSHMRSLSESGANPPVPDPDPVITSLAADASDTDTPPLDVKAKTTRRKPERPLPEDWRPNAVHEAKAQYLGLDVAAQAVAFRDHAETNDRRARDWDAAFRTWLTRAPQFAPWRPVSAPVAAPSPEWAEALRMNPYIARS